MNQFRLFTILCCMVFACAYVSAQEYRTETGILFRQGQSDIDPDFANNRQQLTTVVELLDSVKNNSNIEVRSIEFCGSASPEGSSELNRKLSNSRLKALEAYVRERMDIPDELVTYNDHYIPWETLAENIAKSDMEHKDEVLEIIKKELPDATDHQGDPIDGRIPVLKGLYDGKVWAILLRDHFRDLRNAYMVLVTFAYRDEEPAAAEVVTPVTEQPTEVTDGAIAALALTPATEQAEQPIEEQPVEEEPTEEPRHLYLKTNAIGWGMLMVNLAAEIDFGKNWSAQLPIYYSGWNYFSETLKFRNFTIQPEVRYWFWGNTNDKLFVGAHFGLSYYNFAFNGDYRYQDKDGKTPAIGGGLSVGYRMPLCKNGRWKMEFSLGAGVYPLHYDNFINVYNGALSHVEKKTYFGLDHASVSFAYMFNLKKKSK